MPARHLSLARQTLVLQLAVVLLALSVSTVAWLIVSRSQLQDDYGERALAIADAVASLPAVAAGLQASHPPATLEPLGATVEEASGMSFVVITDHEGVRQAHPDPDRIGERVSTDPGPALAGQRVIEVDTGTLGTSIRGKAPVVDDGEVIGMVSVGVLQDDVFADFLAQRLPTALLFLVPALALGTVGSLLLTRRIKRLTFGLEPREIAGLLEQREAMLHGIREGVVGLDADGRLAVVNDEARRLLGLEGPLLWCAPAQVLPSGPLRDLLEGTGRAQDAVVLSDSRVLVANRVPVAAQGAHVGTVVTLRDRTELAELSDELASVRDVADALRAQTHEFDNQLHTLAGLIELGHYDDAVAMITESSSGHQRRSESMTHQLGDPTIAALLLAKSTAAEERGVEVLLTPESRLPHELEDPRPLVTVLGNLVDNATEAVADHGGGRVAVTVRADGDALRVRVADDGPGVPDDATTHIFTRGWSTKEGDQRGLGLALVAREVARLDGTLNVGDADGAVFDVVIPGMAPRTSAAVEPGPAGRR